MLIDKPKRPCFSTQDAEKIANDEYGISASARQLPSERDQNFYLEEKSGREFVLKIAHVSEREDILDCQNKAMEHLAQHYSPSPCPIVHPALSGEKITSVKHDDGSSHFVRVLTYIPGTPLAEVKDHSAELMRNLGDFLGRIDKAFESFTHPASHRRFHWDLRHAPEVISKYMDCISDADKRQLIRHHLKRFETVDISAWSRLRRSFIHNDANDYNIIIDPDDTTGRKIVGIIDFGDVVYSYTAVDLAVAAAYAMLDKADPLAAAAQIIGGYHNVYPLTELELELLFILICTRLILSVTISAHQQSLEPDNEYLRISEQPARALLERLAQVDTQNLLYLLRYECGLPVCPAGSGVIDRTAYERESVGAMADPEAEPPGSFLGGPGYNIEEIIDKRKSLLGKSLSLAYKRPLKIVRGQMQYLYDDSGRRYLDAVNNVPHVGHCHPRVVKAAQRQMAVLNTNTRYLHDTIVRYAERLCSLLPDPLNVCFFVCSGSEANELALRMARTYTSRDDIIAVEGAYHGNTSSLIDISPYKFDGPGGSGAKPFVHKVAMPDTFRGPYRSDHPGPGKAYAEHVHVAIREAERKGQSIAAFFCESLLGCGGQIVLPDNYLKQSFEYVRKNGGICVADEVQVGFGRVGSHFWGFETQGVVPDIVTLGKPMGNGHPLAAVVTSRKIADAFANGMEYFNTYGGNPVSCAVGMAVLDVIEEEGLQQHALEVGSYLKEGLEKLTEKHLLIGDVRGMGLFIGIELVLDRQTLTPAREHASRIIEKMKDRGILISTDGPLENVLKIKPPMVFSHANADQLISTLDEILAEERI